MDEEERDKTETYADVVARTQYFDDKKQSEQLQSVSRRTANENQSESRFQSGSSWSRSTSGEVLHRSQQEGVESSRVGRFVGGIRRDNPQFRSLPKSMWRNPPDPDRYIPKEENIGPSQRRILNRRNQHPSDVHKFESNEQKTSSSAEAFIKQEPLIPGLLFVDPPKPLSRRNSKKRRNSEAKPNEESEETPIAVATPLKRRGSRKKRSSGHRSKSSGDAKSAERKKIQNEGRNDNSLNQDLSLGPTKSQLLETHFGSEGSNLDSPNDIVQRQQVELKTKIERKANDLGARPKVGQSDFREIPIKVENKSIAKSPKMPLKIENKSIKKSTEIPIKIENKSIKKQSEIPITVGNKSIKKQSEIPITVGNKLIEKSSETPIKIESQPIEKIFKDAATESNKNTHYIHLPFEDQETQDGNNTFTRIDPTAIGTSIVYGLKTSSTYYEHVTYGFDLKEESLSEKHKNIQDLTTSVSQVSRSGKLEQKTSERFSSLIPKKIKSIDKPAKERIIAIQREPTLAENYELSSTKTSRNKSQKKFISESFDINLPIFVEEELFEELCTLDDDRSPEETLMNVQANISTVPELHQASVQFKYPATFINDENQASEDVDKEENLAEQKCQEKEVLSNESAIDKNDETESQSTTNEELYWRIKEKVKKKKRKPHTTATNTKTDDTEKDRLTEAVETRTTLLDKDIKGEDIFLTECCLDDIKDENKSVSKVFESLKETNSESNLNDQINTTDELVYVVDEEIKTGSSFQEEAIQEKRLINPDEQNVDLESLAQSSSTISQNQLKIEFKSSVVDSTPISPEINDSIESQEKGLFELVLNSVKFEIGNIEHLLALDSQKKVSGSSEMSPDYFSTKTLEVRSVKDKTV